MAEMGKKRDKTTTSMADEDRISKLPDTVIVHILSFLPTVHVVRTCILSRRWKFMWFSVPTLSFSDTSADFQSPDGLEKFYKYVDDCLEHRRSIMYYFVDSVVTSFKLEMRNFYRSSKSAHLDKWLAFAVKIKVKEINLCLSSSCEDHHYYCLPETVVNARDLTILELEGLDFVATYSIGLPALKTLSMKNFFFQRIGKVDAVSKLLLGCPCLDKLMLDLGGSIGGIGDLRLQSLSLKFIKIENCVSAYALPFKVEANALRFQVEAINLEYLVLNGPIFEISNLSACKAIRNLSLNF